jgi:hypothetical protein
MEALREALKRKPFNRKNILHHYLPLVGSGSYVGLGVSIIQPGVLRRLHPSGNDATNIFLATSIAGSFLYLYDRKHLKGCSTGEKALYCLFASTMFNLGSLLLWAMIRSGSADVHAPQFKLFLAASSAYWLTNFGIKYLDVIDNGASAPAGIKK